MARITVPRAVRSARQQMSLRPRPVSPGTCTAGPGLEFERSVGLCQPLLAPPRYACVGAGLLFKVLAGRMTRKGHGPLPATCESPAT